MRKSLLIISIFMLFVSGACGMSSGFGFHTIQGSGDITTESREVSNFEYVSVCCGMELYLTQGDSESLEIEADDNFMDEIVTTVVNGTLEVKYQQMNNTSYQPSQPVLLYLTMEEVRGVEISGGGYFETEALIGENFDLSLSGGSDAWIADLESGDIEAQVSGGGKLKAASIKGAQIVMDFSGGSDMQVDDLIATSIEISNSGGGRVEFDFCETDQLELDFSGSSDGEIFALNAEQLYINSSGGGTTEISGNVTDQTVTLSGGSSYKAGALKSEGLIFSSSGGGDSTVWVTESLSAHLSGGSDLSYYGDPTLTSSATSGGSNLNSLGEHQE